MNRIPVYYTQKLLANSESFSPSSSKPIHVIESWLKLGIPLEIIEPAPLPIVDFYLAHGSFYVDRVLACQAANGFDNRSPEVAASLPFTSGAFVAAANAALNNGEVAVAPVAGFHHAHHDYGGGFCTFNGLVVAAQVLKRDRHVNKVGIIDFDNHYGNGTTDIIKQRGLGGWLKHYSAGAEYHSFNQASGFLDRIPELVTRFTDCDIILYQAGADPHVHDPLGGWLTTEQIARRDRLVFECAKDLGIPVAWDLAGGYQVDIRNVLDIHDNTLRECWEIYSK